MLDSHKALESEYMLDASDIKNESWMGDRITVKTYGYEPDFAPEGKQIIKYYGDYLKIVIFTGENYMVIENNIIRRKLKLLN